MQATHDAFTAAIDAWVERKARELRREVGAPGGGSGGAAGVSADVAKVVRQLQVAEALKQQPKRR